MKDGLSGTSGGPMPEPAIRGFAFFDTHVGRCGLGWTQAGVSAVALPEANDETMRARFECRGAVQREPSAAVARVIARIQGLIGGSDDGMADVVLDLDGVAPFHRTVYAVTRAIPPGATLTYGEVAQRVGRPDAAREVGFALGKNPCPIIVPCHRVVGSGGKLVGFSAPGGIGTKRHLLSIEAGQAALF